MYALITSTTESSQEVTISYWPDLRRTQGWKNDEQYQEVDWNRDD